MKMSGRDWPEHCVRYDALSITEIEYKGTSDEDIMAYANQVNRAVLTHNVHDFVPLAEQCFLRQIAHPGVIVASQISKGGLLRRTVALLDTLTPASLANTLRFV